MKGQIAIEQLVTYGWALLVITAVFVVVWQFGIFNPSRWTGKQVTGFSMFDVHDFKIDSRGKLTFVFSSRAEKKIVNVTVSPETWPVSSQTISEMEPGEIKTVRIENVLSNATVGESYSINVNITYIANNIVHVDRGRLMGEVEVLSLTPTATTGPNETMEEG